MKPTLPVVLTIAGSDNSCGAGLQADLKTITALGCYAQTAVTCVVAEIPGRVDAIQAVRPDMVAAQIRLSFRAFPVAAVKTGMLFSASVIRAVDAALSKAGKAHALVVDPVMVASSGDPLLKPSAIAAYRSLLFPKAVLVTPNLDELRILAGQSCPTLDAAEDAARGLVDRYGCAFLVKGGHFRHNDAIDTLVTPRGSTRFSAPFIRGADTHGTGCTYSAAIASGLAKGLALEHAVGEAKAYITAAIQERLRWGRVQALHHAAAGQMR